MPATPNSTVEVALRDEEIPGPGDIVMLEAVGAALVLAVSAAAPPTHELLPGEQAIVLEVEAFTVDNHAPDIP